MMNVKSLMEPRNKEYLDLQIDLELLIHNKMRLNTCYSANNLRKAIGYDGPEMSFRMTLDNAVERKKFKLVEYDGRRYYYRGIAIIREMDYQ